MSAMGGAADAVSAGLIFVGWFFGLSAAVVFVFAGLPILFVLGLITIFKRWQGILRQWLAGGVATASGGGLSVWLLPRIADVFAWAAGAFAAVAAYLAIDILSERVAKYAR